MGKLFGNLAHVRNQISFTISPFEQKPFAKFFKTGVPNFVKRLAEEAPYMVPPIVALVAFYTWTTNKAAEMSTKAYHAGHGGEH